MVENTCVACHLGEGANHSFEPDVAACQGCHADIEDFDFSGLQSEVQGDLDVIGNALVAYGVLSDITVDGHPTVTEAPEGIATGLYNWIYIAHEDKSLGVHNPAYTKAMLAASKEALQPSAEAVAACADLEVADACTLGEGDTAVDGVCTTIIDTIACLPLPVEEAAE